MSKKMFDEREEAVVRRSAGGDLWVMLILVAMFICAAWVLSHPEVVEH